MTQPGFSVAVPWSLSHYIPLGGIHPLYQAFLAHAPKAVHFYAWDNVRLHRRLSSDASIRNALVERTRVYQYEEESLEQKSSQKDYYRFISAENRVLTYELPGDIEFYHTLPFPSLTRPFVLYLEYFPQIFLPFAKDSRGHFERAEEIRIHYRGLLRHPMCLGVFSHFSETRDALRRFLSDPLIDGKLFASSIGLTLSACDPGKHPPKPSLDRPRFLFVGDDFFLSGGLRALRFWKAYVGTGRPGVLIISGIKPKDEDLYEHDIDPSWVSSECGRSIIWAPGRPSTHELTALMEAAHFALLPCPRRQSTLIMQAMTAGAVPVLMDHAGTPMYVTDKEDGIVLGPVRTAHDDMALEIPSERDRRNEDLNDNTVSELLHRVEALLDAPGEYAELGSRIERNARTRYNGPRASAEFWQVVSDLHQHHKSSIAKPVKVSRQTGFALLDCTIQHDRWAQVFDSAAQPVQRINTQQSVVWESGGALIHAYGNPQILMNDWSVLAQHVNVNSPLLTFANTLEELEGRYLRSVDDRIEAASVRVIRGIQKALMPYPRAYRCATFGLSLLRRFVAFGLIKPRRNPDIELVRQGISGYNIIRCVSRFYAIPETEGEFSPEKAERGGYSRCFSGSSLNQVIRSIAASLAQPVRSTFLNGKNSKAELVREAFHGFNIVRFNDKYHALRQSDWAIRPASQDSDCFFSSRSIEEVEDAIISMLDSHPHYSRAAHPETPDQAALG